MNIETADFIELQNECVCDDDLYNYIANVKDNAEKFISEVSDKELREFLSDYVINNSEC